MNNVVYYLIGALVVMVLVSALLPSVLQSFHNTNTTGWTTAEFKSKKLFLNTEKSPSLQCSVSSF